MEGAKNVAVIPVRDLEWSDVGSWDSLFDVIQNCDDYGNIVIGNEPVLNDTKNTLVYSNQDKRTLAIIGVHDLVVVDTGDVVLVCHKDQAQKVKSVVEQLKSAGNIDIV